MRCLITGSTNLGREIIETFANNGFDIICTYCNSKDNAYSLKKYIKEKYNVKINIFKCDLSNEMDINNLVDNVDADILINNASISMDSEISVKTKDEFMKVLEVNTVGTFLLSRNLLEKNKVKTIINISSTDSVDTYSFINIDYSVSKLGLNLITKVLSEYYKSKKICAILPNWIDTDPVLSMDKDYLESELKRINQKELLKKTDVAKLVYEVATSDKYKTGDMVRVG